MAIFVVHLFGLNSGTAVMFLEKILPVFFPLCPLTDMFRSQEVARVKYRVLLRNYKIMPPTWP